MVIIENSQSVGKSFRWLVGNLNNLMACVLFSVQLQIPLYIVQACCKETAEDYPSTSNVDNPTHHLKFSLIMSELLSLPPDCLPWISTGRSWTALFRSIWRTYFSTTLLYILSSPPAELKGVSTNSVFNPKCPVQHLSTTHMQK